MVSSLLSFTFYSAFGMIFLFKLFNSEFIVMSTIHLGELIEVFRTHVF